MFAIWFGYDGWLNPNIKSVAFNRVMAPLWLAGAIYYTVQNLRDQRRTARARGVARRPRESRLTREALSPCLEDVADPEHREARATGRAHDHDLVALLLAQQRTRHGRVDADVAGPGVGLVGADDAVLDLLALLALERDPCAEEDPCPPCSAEGLTTCSSSRRLRRKWTRRSISRRRFLP